MLCARCVSIFQDPSLEGLHHKDIPSLEKAAEAGCRICLYLMNQRRLCGPDEEGESSSDSILRYTLEYAESNHDHWELSFENSKPRWAQHTEQHLPVSISVHVCKGHDVPPFYDEFVTQAAQDLVLEPWRVRRNPFPSSIIPDSSGDEKVAATARGWLERCRSSHISCLRATDDRNQHWCPRRLVAVQDENSGWRIASREEFDDRRTIRYATLSHCWGPMPSFLMLTSENFQTLRKGMTDEDLPRSFLDAVITVRRLGIEYVWVDSLCILQSGDGSENDWRDNAAELSSIYLNSELNLSIDHASSPSDGAFVKRDPEFFQPCHVWSPVLTSTCPPRRRRSLISEGPFYDLDMRTWWATDQELARKYDKESVTVDADSRLCTIFTELDFRASFLNLPLTKRAWVYQERLMSPRVLHFTADRIGWECLESDWLTEYLPEGVPCGRCRFDTMDSPAFDIDSLIDTSLLQDRRSDEDQQRWVYRTWWTSIREYTSRELSHPQKDKLVAFAAVAKKWTSVFKGGYYAGMFRSDLPTGLLWQPNPHGFRHRPILYRAPSWSWASMDGEILEAHYNFAEAIVNHVELLDIDVALKNPHEPYGQVEGGTLTLSGFLLPWFSDGDLPDTSSEMWETLSYRDGYMKWEFTFHHSIFNQDVNFMFDDQYYRPPITESLRLVPIRGQWYMTFEGRSTTILRGLIILKLGRLYARIGTFETDKEGTKPMIDNMELRERIDIV